jgi:glyoxylase-like metal-dependent hydrolase (beta-lactamase superfamily II)
MSRTGSIALGAVLALAIVAAPAFGQVSFVGDWTGRYHEDQPDRVPGEEPNNYAGLPVNEAARMYADSWDVERTTVLEHQCQPYTMPYLFHGPLQFRIWEERQPDSQELLALKFYIGTYQQWRTIWMDGRPHPPEYAPHTFVGFSTGEWNGDILTVTTTHLKAGFFRRSGIPQSDRTTLVEHFIRHGNVMSHVTIATDPVYLTEPYVRSQEFVLMERNNTNWLYNCEYANEIPRPRHQVPMFLPGKNPWLTEISAKYGVPQEAVRGGATTTRPEYADAIRAGRATRAGGVPAPAVPDQTALRAPERPQTVPAGEVHTVHVQGNVHMIVGSGANVAVQVGPDGVVVVDTGGAALSAKVLAAIRQLSDKPIRWVLNTTFRPDHIGGNETVAFAGKTVNGNVAAVVSHENANARMIAAKVPDQARPYNTFFEESRDFPFNGEPVVLYHGGAASSDADMMVFFRRSDVIVTGDLYSTTTYPVIDLANGGSVAGSITALNRILEQAVPSKYLQEGGTFIIPGHGRISDEADVVEYRDMLVIVAARVRDMVERGLTLDEVKAARPSLDYDGRYATPTGPTSTSAFIESLYQDAVAAVKASAGRAR